ncbi:hypothetical protein ScPMuIL_018967 [Solemya velum]
MPYAEKIFWVFFSDIRENAFYPCISETGTDCSDVLNDDESTQSRVYSVVVDGAEQNVYCEMDLYGGGWTIHGKVLDFSRRKSPTETFGLAMIATITGLIKIVMGEKFLKKFARSTPDEGVRLKDGVAMVFKTKVCDIDNEAEQAYNNPNVVDVETAISSPKKRRWTAIQQHRIREATNQTEYSDALKDCPDWCGDKGLSVHPFREFKDREELLKLLLQKKFFTVYTTRLDNSRKASKPLFVYENKKLTFPALPALYKVIRSAEGSNDYVIEDRALCCLDAFLADCQACISELEWQHGLGWLWDRIAWKVLCDDMYAGEKKTENQREVMYHSSIEKDERGTPLGRERYTSF